MQRRKIRREVRRNPQVREPPHWTKMPRDTKCKIKIEIAREGMRDGRTDLGTDRAQKDVVGKVGAVKAQDRIERKEE